MFGGIRGENEVYTVLFLSIYILYDTVTDVYQLLGESPNKQLENS